MSLARTPLIGEGGGKGVVFSFPCLETTLACWNSPNQRCVDGENRANAITVKFLKDVQEIAGFMSHPLGQKRRIVFIPLVH